MDTITANITLLEQLMHQTRILDPHYGHVLVLTHPDNTLSVTCETCHQVIFTYTLKENENDPPTP